MKTLLITIFVLFGYLIGNANVHAPEIQQDPKVKITVNYTTSVQVHEVRLSEVKATTAQIQSEPDAWQITTCSYQFSNGDCNTGPHQTCAEAEEVFWECACAEYAVPDHVHDCDN